MSLTVIVKNNNVGQAYKVLTKILNKDGLFRELRDREAYCPPSKKRARKHKAALIRIRKDKRKRDELFENIESRLVYRTGYKKK